MICLELILGFLTVGLFSFGGAYSAIPLIRDVVLSYGWLDDAMLSNMIAVSESTPGPIMVNLATYVGNSQAGLPGAILATAAVVLPSFIIILLVMALLRKTIVNPYVQAILRGLKPCLIGLIIATGISMILENIMLTSRGPGVSMKNIIVTAIIFMLPFACMKITKKRLSPIQLLIASALIGMAAY